MIRLCDWLLEKCQWAYDLRGKMISREFSRRPPRALWWESAVRLICETITELLMRPRWNQSFKHLEEVTARAEKGRQEMLELLEELVKYGERMNDIEKKDNEPGIH